MRKKLQYFETQVIIHNKWVHLCVKLRDTEDLKLLFLMLIDKSQAMVNEGVYE